MPTRPSLPPITGDQARDARKSLRVSQADVASAVGIPRPTYSLFESGRYRLDDRQQRRLREYLGDALPDAPADDPDDDGQPTRRARQAVGAPRRAVPVDDPEPEPETPADQAEAALDELRELARGPGGVRSMRAAQAIDDAETALEALDYSELLELAEDREVILPKAQPDVDALHRMEQKDVLHWETSLRAQLICKALYGPHLQGCDFDALDGVEDQLHQALPKEKISTGSAGKKRDWLGDLVGHGDAHLRRAELAPHIVQAAKNRAAPLLEGVGTMGA